MRQVLYRAKVLNKKNWIYRQPFQIRGTWYMYCSLWDKVRIDHKTLCQSTGQLDVEQNEIYENDIVEHESVKGRKDIDLITFEHGSFGTESWHLDDMRKIKIIGNKFDNPELLGDTK